MPHYRAFGLLLDSDRPLPGIPSPGEGAPDLVIATAGPEGVAPVPLPGDGMQPLLHDDLEAPWASVRRDAGEFLVRFWGIADFHLLPASGRLEVRPFPGVRPETLLHALMDGLLPCLLAHRGMLVLHGSLVPVPGGAAAFLGDSGLGKSTLAAAFGRRTGVLLGDDTVVVSLESGSPVAIPSYPGVRLLPDQAAALGMGESLGPMAEGSTKGRFNGGAAGTRFRGDPLPLRRLYLLEPPSGDRLLLERMPSTEALIALLYNSYRLDPEDRDRLRSQFEILSRPDLVGSVRRLRLPRGLEHLEAVIEAIEDDCR